MYYNLDVLTRKECTFLFDNIPHTGIASKEVSRTSLASKDPHMSHTHTTGNRSRRVSILGKICIFRIVDKLSEALLLSVFVSDDL